MPKYGLEEEMSDAIEIEKRENFERAFSGGGGGCRRECKCGREFYNPDRLWSWEDGEIEALQSRGATSLDYTVSTLFFEGSEYVMDCDCWHERAAKIIQWMDGHAGEIAEYLSLEKERKTSLAKHSPTVRDP